MLEDALGHRADNKAAKIARSKQVVLKKRGLINVQYKTKKSPANISRCGFKPNKSEELKPVQSKPACNIQECKSNPGILERGIPSSRTFVLNINQTPVEKWRQAPDKTSPAGIKSKLTHEAYPRPPESSSEIEKPYAGAKFSEPPSPSVLPKPPQHWVREETLPRTSQQMHSSKDQMSDLLRTLLRLQAEP